jgi:ABC-type Na+ efflux pump permease subunit
VPLSSPLVLPGRVALHAASVGTVVLSLALLVLAIPAALLIAARLYRGGVLSAGAQPPFRLAWRASAREA